MRIIVADDSRIMRDRMRSFLRDLGHEVVGMAENGVEAVTMCESLRPDIAIIDVVMPALGGQEAALRIERAGTASFLIIATSQGQKQLFDFCEQHGFGAYIKPYEKWPLSRVIEKTVAGVTQRAG